MSESPFERRERYRKRLQEIATAARCPPLGKRFPFLLVPSWIPRDKRLSARELRVLLAVCDLRDNATGIAYRAGGTRKAISDLTGIKGPNVSATLRRLQERCVLVLKKYRRNLVIAIWGKRPERAMHEAYTQDDGYGSKNEPSVPANEGFSLNPNGNTNKGTDETSPTTTSPITAHLSKPRRRTGISAHTSEVSHDILEPRQQQVSQEIPITEGEQFDLAETHGKVVGLAADDPDFMAQIGKAKAEQAQ